MRMFSRYVVVPATPVETECVLERGRYYSKTVKQGFNLYDNQDKQRLKPVFTTRVEANVECERLNSERLHTLQPKYS